MADIAAVEFVTQGLKGYSWSGVTENDTPLTHNVRAGTYTISVEGDFGGASIEIQRGNESGNEASIDADNLTFTENGSYNVEMANGYVMPVVTGGSSTDVDIVLKAIK